MCDRMVLTVNAGSTGLKLGWWTRGRVGGGPVARRRARATSPPSATAIVHGGPA